MFLVSDFLRKRAKHNPNDRALKDLLQEMHGLVEQENVEPREENGGGTGLEDSDLDSSGDTDPWDKGPRHPTPNPPFDRE